MNATKYILITATLALGVAASFTTLEARHEEPRSTPVTEEDRSVKNRPLKQRFECSDARRDFDFLDRNHDGTLNRDEFYEKGQGTASAGDVMKGKAIYSFDELDRNADGVVSRTEWRGVRSAFNDLDANSDRYLTREEMEGGTIRTDHFSRLDQDANTSISPTEWRGSDRAFKRFDDNNDRRISRDEFYDKNNDRQALFDELDANNDGRITEAEWRGNTAAFETLDYNHDGRVSKAEFYAKDRLSIVDQVFDEVFQY